ncbi:hypothetical protein AYI68_g1093, partial [Smittium mucronatum]
MEGRESHVDQSHVW